MNNNYYILSYKRLRRVTEYKKPSEEIVQVKFEGKNYPIAVEKILRRFDPDNECEAGSSVAKAITGRKWTQLVKYVAISRNRHPRTLNNLTRQDMEETLSYLDPKELIWKALKSQEGKVRCIECERHFRENSEMIHTIAIGIYVCDTCDRVLPDDENYRAGIAKIIEKNVYQIEA